MWIRYTKLVDIDGSFKPCPICGGEVKIRKQGIIIFNPRCKSCNRHFRLCKKLFCLGFEIITPP